MTTNENAGAIEVLAAQLQRIEQLDREAKVYKEILASIEKRREMAVAGAELQAQALRRSGWESTIQTAFGFAKVVKARKRVEVREGGAFERAMRERFGDAVCVTPAPKFSVAEAKKLIRQLPDGDWVFPSENPDEQGEIVPGIMTIIPGEHDYRVTLHVGRAWPDEVEQAEREDTGDEC